MRQNLFSPCSAAALRRPLPRETARPGRPKAAALHLLSAFILLASTALNAQTLRIFGSASAETQLTPANSASSLNPRNIGNVPYRANVGDITTFADLQPDDKKWKLGAKLRADVTDNGADELTLGELYLQLNVTDWLTLTGGRVVEKWGSGYAWNPAAFISPRKNPSDPNDRRSSYSGRDMIKAEALLGSTSVSMYALEGGEVAFRAYRLIGATDVSLFAHYDETTTPGISVSRVFGDALELHAEASRGKVLLGGQYTFANQWNVVVELYRDGDGLSPQEWSDFRSDVAAAHDRESFLDVNSRYRPLQMAREYAFIRVAREWQSTNVSSELIVIPSLRDGSSIVRASLSYKLRPSLSVYVIDTEFLGGADSEMSYMQVERATTIGARLHF